MVERKDRLGGELDIRLQAHRFAVSRDARLIAGAEEPAREREMPCTATARVRDGDLVRVDDDLASKPIDDDGVACANGRQRVGGTDDGRDLERPGHDGRVARSRPDLGDEGDGDTEQAS